MRVGTEVIGGVQCVLHTTKDRNEQRGKVKATCTAKRNNYVFGKVDFM